MTRVKGPHGRGRALYGTPPPRASAGEDQQRGRFACQLCTERKVKCDKGQPSCSYCVRRGVACVPCDIDPTKPHVKRLPALLERLRIYEDAMREANLDPAEVLASAQRGGVRASTSRQSIDGTTSRRASQGTQSSPGYRGADPATLSTNATEYDRLRELIDNDPATTATSATPSSLAQTTNSLSSPSSPSSIHNTPSNGMWTFMDGMFEKDGCEHFHFDDPCPASPIAHPEPIHALFLLHVYEKRIHPCVRLVHLPTVQSRLFALGSMVGSAPAPEQALYACMWEAALLAIEPEECLAMLGRTHHQVAAELKRTARTALHRADVWRSSRLQTLQALTLHTMVASLATAGQADPRAVAVFTATLDRLARRMGLHRDSPRSGRLEQHLCRCLWWEISILDSKCCERSGAGAGVLSTSNQVPVPDPIAEQEVVSFNTVPLSTQTLAPASDMILPAVRYELQHFLARLRAEQGDGVGWTEFSGTTRSRAAKLSSIDHLEARIREGLLRYAAGSDSLARLSRMHAESQLARMRLLALIGGDAGHERGDEDDVAILEQCLIQVEIYAVAMTTEAFVPFRWLFNLNLPFVATVHMMDILRRRVDGDLVERCWAALRRSIELWQARFKSLSVGGVRSERAFKASPAMLFGSHLLRAWDAREAAMSALGRPLEEPDFVATIRRDLVSLGLGAGVQLEPRETGSSLVDWVQDNQNIDWSQWLSDSDALFSSLM